MALCRPCRNSQVELREPPAAAPLLEEATNSICSRCSGLASLGLSSIHRRHDKSLATARQFPPRELRRRGFLTDNVRVMHLRPPPCCRSHSPAPSLPALSSRRAVT